MILNNIGLRLRTIVFGGSNSAFKLGCKSPEKRDFCRSIIQIKNNNAQARLVNSSISDKERANLERKIGKYNRQEYTLTILDNIKLVNQGSKLKVSDQCSQRNFVSFLHNTNKTSVV